MRARDLDDRWLPVAARRVRRWAVGLAAVRERLGHTRRAVGAEALDARYGDLRPFAVLRDKPPVGLALSAAVLAAAVAVAVAVEDDGARTTSVETAGPVGIASTSLGPKPGDRTDDYVARATESLRAAVRETPKATRVALVSFEAYRSPEDAAALVDGFSVPRAFLRARAAGERAAPLPVDIRSAQLLAELRKAFADTARNRTLAQKAYQSYVDTLSGTSARDKAFRDLYAAFATSSGVEAAEYGRGCACVYGVLVTATPAQMLVLRARPGVRALEVAPQGLEASDVQVQPLLPEIEGVVPRPNYGGRH